MSPKLHRGPGQDGVTAERIRVALAWIASGFILIWTWTVACTHVAHTWKDGVIITLFKKKDPAQAINYRGITLLAVLGKCFVYILITRLIWAIHHVFLEHQFGLRPHRGRTQGFSISQRLI